MDMEIRFAIQDYSTNLIFTKIYSNKNSIFIEASKSTIWNNEASEYIYQIDLSKIEDETGNQLHVSDTPLHKSWHTSVDEEKSVVTTTTYYHVDDDYLWYIKIENYFNQIFTM